MTTSRKDGRGFNELRPVSIVPDAAPYAEGSAEIAFGNTRLVVSASVEKELPVWMSGEEDPARRKGWITAEYGMLPRATHTRNKREAAQGKQSGRTLEIQRLIGRALRAAVDLASIPGITIRLDCDVLRADGGTRTAAITGGWVALARSLNWCLKNGLLEQPARIQPIAAISAGFVGGRAMLDLCYEEDSQADFDLNIVQDGSLRLIEIQGTSERAPLPAEGLGELLTMATEGIRTLQRIQQEALA